MPRALNIGTRGSKLALAQARRVQAELAGPGEIRIIKTSGDRFQDKPLHEQDGIGFFTKEIEQALLRREIDLAVHSLKDLPTALAPGLTLSVVLRRDDAGDVLLAREECTASNERLPLRPGTRVGASSLRRQALLRSVRTDVDPAPIRGNVPTRVAKAASGEHDAIVLARAGLSRLSLDVAPLIAFDLNPDLWVCAPGQGAIAVEAREDDPEVHDRLGALDHRETRDCVGAERQLLLTYGGGCHAPFGAYARASDGGYVVTVAAPGSDGTFRIRGFHGASLDDVHREAEAWIRGGCAGSAPLEEAWLARPARPWS